MLREYYPARWSQRRFFPPVGNAIKSDSAAVNAGKATSGAENAATYPKLKDELRQQNLNNIAKLDPRLSEAVKGSGTTNPNFSIGMGTAAEADRLGKLWVGDGGKLVDNQKNALVVGLVLMVPLFTGRHHRRKAHLPLLVFKPTFKYWINQEW